jgi:hypothetical protein
MKPGFLLLSAATALVMVVSSPSSTQAQQAPQAEHDHTHDGTTSVSEPAPQAPTGNAMEMMGRMRASQQKLDDLVKKMKDAKGPEKTAAIEALLTALVQEHREMHDAMMSNMNGMMMKMMGGHRETGGVQPAPR